MSKQPLKDKVLVITGASAGIGAATAILAAREGMKVVLAARRVEKLKTIAREINTAGGEALPLGCDVVQREQVEALVQKTIAEYGRLDVMYANAGYGMMKDVLGMGMDAHRAMFEVNYFGAVSCFEAALPRMRSQGSGHLMMTSSFLGKVGISYFGAYSATKSAQSILCESMWHELRKENIAVTAVHPVGTKTEFFDVVAEKGGVDSMAENTPEAFTQTPEHVGRCVIKAMKKPRPEVWPNGMSRYLAAFGVAFPQIYQRMIRKNASLSRRKLQGEA